MGHYSLYKNNVWRESILRACLTGWSRPSSTTGHALEAMDRVLVDLGQLQARRDKLHAGLRGQGYEITKPQAGRGFYQLVRLVQSVQKNG